MYIYIYIHNIVGFRGFASSIMLCLRGGIPRPMGDFPESLSRAMLAGVIFIGRLGVSSLTRVRCSLPRIAADGVAYTSHLPTCPFDKDI